MRGKACGGWPRPWAKEEAVELLDENLKQEKETLREVEKIATRLSDESAKQPSTA